MAEHIRSTNKANGDVYQWVDETRCIILDKVTGENVRFGWDKNSIASYEEALEFVEGLDSLPDRYVIVRLDCIVPHKIE